VSISSSIDVKIVLEKIKNVKKRKKRGQNKKRLKTLNKKTLALICSTLVPNAVRAVGL